MFPLSLAQCPAAVFVLNDEGNARSATASVRAVSNAHILVPAHDLSFVR